MMEENKIGGGGQRREKNVTAQSRSMTKSAILFLLRHTKEPISVNRLAHAMMRYEFVDYFEMHNCIEQLEQDGLLEAAEETDCYVITQIGKAAIDSAHEDMALELRENLRRFLRYEERRQRIESDIVAEILTKNEIEHVAVCKIMENDTCLLSLEMNMPNKRTAKKVCKSFRKNAQQIYQELLYRLTS